MAQILKNLIVNKWYKTREMAESKIGKAWAKNIITDDEYDELTELLNTYYPTESTDKE